MANLLLDRDRRVLWSHCRNSSIARSQVMSSWKFICKLVTIALLSCFHKIRVHPGHYILHFHATQVPPERMSSRPLLKFFRKLLSTNKSSVFLYSHRRYSQWQRLDECQWHFRSTQTLQSKKERNFGTKHYDIEAWYASKCRRKVKFPTEAWNETLLLEKKHPIQVIIILTRLWTNMT